MSDSDITPLWSHRGSVDVASVLVENEVVALTVGAIPAQSVFK